MKKVKAHNMYSKTGIKKVAKTEKEHLALKKRGYTHTPPKKKELNSFLLFLYIGGALLY